MLKKVARGQVIDAVAPEEHPRRLIKDAARHEFEYQPRPGYVYVRSRMISSRVNDNYDGFPGAEIEKGYRTFQRKPAFVNHANEDHRRMRGLIIDSHLHHHRTPDGGPDTWVEGLHEIDALTYPKLAHAILHGKIQRTSMGVDVDYSICSACGNKATDIFSYCTHIPGQKGRKFFKAGKGGSFIYETCHGLRFFENSLLVEPPADPTAVIIGEPVTGPGLEHLTAGLRRTASRERLLVRGPGPTWNARPVEAAKYESPADHPWFQQHPVHPQHIVGMWNKATDDEKEQGKRWYPDAHLVARSLATLAPTREGKKPSDPDARHPKGDAHLGAGLLAIYSPQTPWAANMHNAARSAHQGSGIGGPGSGIMASTHQKNAADRVLRGEHYNDVLAGPKIRDFAHLIEHGGDEHPVGHPDHQAHVVVDRHALSVATGTRLTNEEYDAAPIKGGARRKDGSIPRAGYDHVVGAYHQAAQQISRQEGKQVHGHQVQAVTWLAQQRLNQKAERDRAAGGADVRLDRGREQVRTRHEKGWNEFRRQHLPEMGREPGTGYTARRRHAYGETIAPPRVDTLRDENCPICFTPETLVRALGGYVPIASLRAGDYVLSRDGIFRRVTQVMCRPYDGVLHEITTRTCVEPIRTTPNHRFMALHGQHPDPRWGDRLCAPGTCAKYGDHYASTGGEITHRLDWTEAQDLRPGHYLSTNVPVQGHDARWVYLPLQFGDEWWFSSSRGNRKGEYCFELTEEFLWMVGLYLSEGSASARHLSFTLHQKEVEYAERLERLFTELGYNTAVRTKPTSHAMWVEVYSTTLAQWLPWWLGSGSHNKRVPPELVNLPMERLYHVVQGVLDGDATKGRRQLKQTSPVLALQVQEFFLRARQPASIYVETPKDKKIAYTVNYALSSTASARNWWVAGQLLSGIKEIRTVPYAGEVYNLMVEGDPSYTVQSVLVHNCGEDSAWDGHRCPVCGYVAPPDPFADPNLDVAKNIDLRQQQQQFDDANVPDPEKAAEEIAGDILVCPNCGTEFPQGEPETVDTDEPEDAQGAPTPAEGDVCPACGKGLLESQSDAEEQEGNPAPVREDEAEDATEEDDDDLDPDVSGKDSGPQWTDAVPVKSSDGQDDPDEDSDDDEEDEEKPVRQGPPRRKG